MEILTLAHCILQYFDVELVTKEARTLPTQMGLLLRPANSVFVKLRPRRLN